MYIAYMKMYRDADNTETLGIWPNRARTSAQTQPRMWQPNRADMRGRVYVRAVGFYLRGWDLIGSHRNLGRGLMMK